MIKFYSDQNGIMCFLFMTKIYFSFKDFVSHLRYAHTMKRTEVTSLLYLMQKNRRFIIESRNWSHKPTSLKGTHQALSWQWTMGDGRRSRVRRRSPLRRRSSGSESGRGARGATGGGEGAEAGEGEGARDDRDPGRESQDPARGHPGPRGLVRCDRGWNRACP